MLNMPDCNDADFKSLPNISVWKTSKQITNVAFLAANELLFLSWFLRENSVRKDEIQNLAQNKICTQRETKKKKKRTHIHWSGRKNKQEIKIKQNSPPQIASICRLYHANWCKPTHIWRWCWQLKFQLKQEASKQKRSSSFSKNKRKDNRIATKKYKDQKIQHHRPISLFSQQRNRI